MPHIAKMAGIWTLGMVPGALYMWFNPDGIPHPSRWSYGPWLWALKYTPYSHVASFIFGVMLAELDEVMVRNSRLRFWLALGGFAGIYGLLTLGPLVPYAIIHDGLLMPLFACIVLGLAGKNPLSMVLGWLPLVFIGESSYCLYLLHFNLWNLLHGSHILEKLGLMRFDPWAQLCAADRDGAVCAALHREAGAETVAQVDGPGTVAAGPAMYAQRVGCSAVCLAHAWTPRLWQERVAIAAALRSAPSKSGSWAK